MPHAFGSALIEAWGVVPDEGRGSLPYALIHGESLVATASFALEAAGVTLLDPRADLEIVRDEGVPLVLHDSLCPLTPVDFLMEAIDFARAHGCIVAGARPVPESGESDDGDTRVEVTSPIVLPEAVVETLESIPVGDFAGLVEDWRARWPLTLLTAPPEGRRIHDADEISGLEALTARTG
jgi:2-C-methyl-D-erythritol 4-phosphate cytidylyltransferase